MAPPTRFSQLALLLLFSVPQISAFTQCYYPDGSIPVDYIFEPCVGTGGHSSCCVPSEGDICQENGLCYFPETNNTFRGACTDRTWNDPACAKDLCVAGNEDTWAWASPCSSNGKDVTYACGTVENKKKITGNCTAGATTHPAIFQTKATSTSKATRYTPPPSVDTAKFTVYTEKHTTVVSAWVQGTTFTTTWETTITSALGQLAASTSSVTGTRGGFTSSTTGTSAPSSSTTAPPASSGGITVSPAVLAGAIAGPVVGLALIAGLFFFLRKRRAAKKDTDGATRLHSSAGGNAPPANGPVGNEQVTPYEVPANEAAFGQDRKYIYTGQTADGKVNGAYEMGTVGGEKAGGYYGGGVDSNVQEVPANERQHPTQYANAGVNNNGVPSPVRSPAPVYSETNGPVVLPVELDGGQGQWQRPAGSNRNGVGNA